MGWPDPEIREEANPDRINLLFRVEYDENSNGEETVSDNGRKASDNEEKTSDNEKRASDNGENTSGNREKTSDNGEKASKKK